MPETITSNSYNPLRNALINNAVNLVMMVVESLAAEGDQKTSGSVFTTAYGRSKLMNELGRKYSQEAITSRRAQLQRAQGAGEDG